MIQTLLRPDDPAGRIGPHGDDVSFSFCGITVHGALVVPEDAIGLAILVDPTNDFHAGPVAQTIEGALHRAGVASLTVDLLTSSMADEPDPIRRAVDRLIAVIDRVRAGPGIGSLPVGLIGLGSGAAVAMWVAGLLRPEVGAVVSLDGCPEGSERWLNLVLAPTLLIVRGDDAGVLEVNRQAVGRMVCEASVQVVDEGSPERVADITADWLLAHMDTCEEMPPSWLAPLEDERTVQSHG